MQAGYSGPTKSDRKDTARVAEVGALLALGYLRLQARQSSQKPSKSAEERLDNAAEESGTRTAFGDREEAA